MDEPFSGIHTIYGVEKEHDTPYLTRIWIGRLRLHIFHRGDADPDCHDHPWDFWTFPLTPYVEEVASPEIALRVQNSDVIASGWTEDLLVDRRVVPAWRPSFRTATHCHRVIGRFAGYQIHNWGSGAIIDPPVPLTDSRKIVTLVWRSGSKRQWGFLKNRDGLWCWTHWKNYVFQGGKHSPCEPAHREQEAVK